MSKNRDSQKKDYSKIEAKNNMVVDNNGEEIDITPTKREKPKPVLDNPPVKRKKGLMERLVVGFLGPEGLPGIGAYLNEEIIVPSIKNIIVEAVTSGINMAIFGERGRSGAGSRTYHEPNRTVYRPNTDYAAPSRTSRYTSAQPEPSRRVEPIRNVRFTVDEYPIESRMAANQVLTTLTEFADQYDYVSVAEYYDILGVESSHTDYNYGWSFESVTKGAVVPLRGGHYIVSLPPVEPI